MTYIKSKYFIGPNVLNLVVGVVVIVDIFFTKYIPQELRQPFETILAFTYIVLVIWTGFYLFFKSLNDRTIEQYKKDVDGERSLKEKYLMRYKNAQEEISDKTLFIHLLKPIEGLASSSNSGNYLIILLIFFVGQFSFDYWKPVGVVIYLVMIVGSILYCIRIISWHAFEREKFSFKGAFHLDRYLTGIITFNALAIFLLFSWGKNTYTRSFGQEIIGGYFEKSEYKTKYYVNVFPMDDVSDNNRLPADIHVYTEEEVSETSEDSYGVVIETKNIIVNKVFWPDGSYLELGNCQLEMGVKVKCRDQDGSEWYIELTNEKVR